MATMKQIDAAVTATNARLDSLAAMLDKLVAVQTTAPAAPAREQRAARRQNRTANTTSRPTTAPQTEAVKYPKATGGAVIGTVKRTARQGYGLLVLTTDGERWINTPRTGPALFAEMVEGQSVSFVVNDNGFLVTDPTEAVATPAAPATTTKLASAVFAPTKPVVTTPSKPVVNAAPTAYAVVTRGDEVCPCCSGSHGNESFRKRELECFSRVYETTTGNRAEGVCDLEFTTWAIEFRNNFAAVMTARIEAAKTPVVEAPKAPTLDEINARSARKAARRARLAKSA